jgi:hypothetical protein
MDKLEYEANVKNRLLDPVLDVKNQRTEFRINDDGSGKVILSSMRLVGLGVFAANDVAYLVAGAGGVIKNIYLYDGNQVLDQCIEANGWLAFTNYLESNDLNASKDKWLMRHNMGYMVDGMSPQNDQLTDGAAPRTDNLFRDKMGTIPTTDSIVNNGYLDLARVLPMLSSVSALPLAVFKNLRLVIEYDNQQDKLIDKNNQSTTSARPILSFDEVIDPQEKAAITKGFKGASWDAIEHDRVVAPAITGGGVNNRPSQVVNANVKNYRGKYLRKIVISKQVTDPTVANEGTVNVSPMGAYSSATCINEKLNLKINGAPKLPNAMDKPNKRLGLLTDAWGTANAYPLNADFGNSVGAAGGGGVSPSGPRTYFILGKFNATSRATQVGLQDYFGCEIEDEVRDMEINFERSGEGKAALATGNERYNSQLHLHMWGLCKKSIMVSGDKYSVSYM